MKFTNLMPIKKIPYLNLVLSNSIPLFGYFLASWDATSIFLYYTVELCAYELIMIAKIILYAYEQNNWHSLMKVVRAALSYMLLHLMGFAFSFIFLVFTAYAISAKEAKGSYIDVLYFCSSNILPVSLIFAEYIYMFIRNQVIRKEYKIIPEEKQLLEITLFHMFLLTALAVINGLMVGIKASGAAYQIVVMFAIILCKIIGQIALSRNKEKYYQENLLEEN